MSSFIAILTWRSYRWKNPSFGPLVLLCSALIAVVTALVYSLWPKDLYGTIIPTCYIKMTRIIWNFGKKHTFSCEHAFLYSLTKRGTNIRDKLLLFCQMQRKRLSTDHTERYFVKFLPKRSWHVRYVTNSSSLGSNINTIHIASDVYNLVGKHAIVLRFYHYRHFRVICWIISHMWYSFYIIIRLVSVSIQFRSYYHNYSIVLICIIIISTNRSYHVKWLILICTYYVNFSYAFFLIYFLRSSFLCIVKNFIIIILKIKWRF